MPVTGDGTTVMRISHRRLERLSARGSIRRGGRCFDVGGWDNSKVVLPAGQSGHPLSPHYFDQNDLWRAGQYRPVAYTRGAVNGAAAHRQVASP